MLAEQRSPSNIDMFSDDAAMLVTMRIDNQLFGIPVHHVRDVLKEQKVAHIPLAAPEIAGSINLRGRIVTVINLRERLKLPAKTQAGTHMFVVVEQQNELYSLMVDSVGDVMNIPHEQIEKPPANLSSNWREVASGINRLQGELLVIIDPKSLLAIDTNS